MGKDDYSKAAEAFKKVTQPAVKKAEAQYFLANLQLIQGKPDEAIKVFNSITKPQSIAVMASAGVGKALLQKGNLDQAKSAFQSAEKKIRALKDESERRNALAVVYNGYGDVLYNEKKYKEAVLAYLRTATLFDSNSIELPKALYAGAKCFIELRKKAGKKSPEGKAFQKKGQILRQELFSRAGGSAEAAKAKSKLKALDK